MIITSWAYVMLWLGYIVNMVVNFPARFGSSVSASPAGGCSTFGT